MKAAPLRGFIGGVGLCLLCLQAAPGQDVSPPQQHESVVINIEVPVRVLKKDAFVDGLTLADFEAYENGVPQPIEAVYLIKGRQVIREERAAGASPPAPPNARNYVLYLDLKEYLPKVDEALEYFFTDVIGERDSLFVVTPVKTYRFKSEALARVPRKIIAERLRDKLKVDIEVGNTSYRRLMRNFHELEAEEFPPEQADVKETMLFDMALEMRDLTEVTEARVTSFADQLKALDGEKHVFLIFQRDVLPAHEFDSNRQAELVRPVGFDVDKIKRIFSDGSITVHCLYITKTPSFALNPMGQRGAVLASRFPDLSADLYASFKEMAVATGGLTESTANPSSALKQAAEASGNYYLVYYRPVAYKPDGRFQEIDIRVKGQGLKVVHRLGYIAD